MALSTHLAVAEDTVIYSNLKKQEHIQFITGAAWLDEEGKHWNVPVRVWVFQLDDSRFRKSLISSALNRKYGLVVTEETSGNFDRRINYLIADNQRGKQIIIELANKYYVLSKTDARGHSDTILNIPVESIPPGQPLIEYQALLPADDSRELIGRCLLIPRQGISIISDIDDTVKISEVTKRENLFANTFYTDFAPVPGMSAVYQKFAAEGASLHFVSSSPWQLYPELNEFLTRENFPPRSISLKTVRFKDRSFFNLFKSGDETKPLQIEPFFERFPERQFILIGDSGEEDAKVYLQFLGKYPEQVKAVFIRQLHPTISTEEVNEQDGKVYYFQNPQEILEQLNL